MKLHIYLFRHGRTFFNEAHKFTGWKDSKLSPNGIKDAKKIAKLLKNKKITVAFTSDLTRAKETLKEVLKYHPNTKIITDKKLRERSYGSLEGKSHSQFINKIGEKDYALLLHWHKIDNLQEKEKKEIIKELGEIELKTIRRSYRTIPPKGESVAMVEKRVRKFIKSLLEFMKKNKTNVAISAHGNSIRPFRRYFEHLSVKEMMQLENPFDDYFEYVIKI